MPSLLLVDDEENLRLALGVWLRKQSYTITAAGSVPEAIAALEAHGPFEVVVTDVRMPGASGLELVAHLRTHSPSTTVIVMSAYGTMDLALEAIRAGAYDYVAKPFRPEELGLVLRKATEREALRRQNRVLRAALVEKSASRLMIGRSAVMQSLTHTISRAAPFKTTVLIQGESGVGKELVARALHDNSPRAAKPFIAINCGAIPPALLESELFGHKRGAFTDATHDKRGLCEQAEGGTLFLDEIGELPLALQVKLLRVLQTGVFRPLGDTVDHQGDVRFLAATLRDLSQDVRDGRFREDLFYRLNVLTIHVPSLRERRDDIELLVQHFIAQYNDKLGTQYTSVAPDAMKRLIEYPWPGNVRELENTVERAMVLGDAPLIQLADLPERLREPKDPLRMVLASDDLSIKRATRWIEEVLIRRALERTRGNRTRAAEILEISHRALLYKIKEFGIT